jgi:uncharacterized SAM-binding protein YcdF (DUF218 family)
LTPVNGMEPLHDNRHAAAGNRTARRGAVAGMILGMLIWISARELGIQAIPILRSSHLILAAAVAGGALGATRARGLLWAAAGVVCLALLLIGYTPFVPSATHAWLKSDPVQPCDAVVSLSSEVYTDGSLDDGAQRRVLHAYELLAAHAAPRLVITRLPPPWRSGLPLIRRQMRAFRLTVPVDEVGPVVNTHDEALAVARLTRERGWKRVLLVTDPLHMRRAAAVFTHAGLPVCCSPCTDGEYDLRSLQGPGDRLAAFRDWLKEWIGCQVYHRRGWM